MAKTFDTNLKDLFAEYPAPEVRQAFEPDGGECQARKPDVLPGRRICHLARPGVDAIRPRGRAGLGEARRGTVDRRPGPAAARTVGAVALRSDEGEAIPEILRRIHERLAAEATPERGDQFWNWMYELTGLHLTHEQVSPHFRRYEVIRQSLTWQYQMKRGEIQGMQRMLLRLGTLEFGPPDETARILLAGRTELEQLDRLTDKMLVANNWAELLATP